MHAQFYPAPAGGLLSVRPRKVAGYRRSVCVRAAATGPGSGKPKDLTQQLQQQCDAFLQVPHGKCSASTRGLADIRSIFKYRET